MANASGIGGHRAGLGATLRTDNWWVGPSFTALALSAWLIYYIWAAWQGVYYSAGPYVSPFYILCGAAPPGELARDHFLLPWPAGLPGWIPSSPALFIGFLPGSFRMTCYYYRKAYYRAFFLTPPGCGVAPAARGGYSGETAILLIQNLHRYTVYIAILLLPVLWYEALQTFYWAGHGPGIGLGTVLLLGNCTLLTCYTLGCHAWRHLIGGRVNCFSCDGFSEAQHSAWSFTTWLNERHLQFAWSSLWWIFACDVYIRLLSMGILPDINSWQGISWMGAH